MVYKFDTKFKVGEILYALVNKKIRKIKIEQIEVNITITDCDNSIIYAKYSCTLNGDGYKYMEYINEEDLYRTKEELINNL